MKKHPRKPKPKPFDEGPPGADGPAPPVAKDNNSYWKKIQEEANAQTAVRHRERRPT